MDQIVGARAVSRRNLHARTRTRDCRPAGRRHRNRALLYCAGGGIGDSLVASVVARALHKRFATRRCADAAGASRDARTRPRPGPRDRRRRRRRSGVGSRVRASAATTRASSPGRRARTARVAQLAEIPRARWPSAPLLLVPFYRKSRRPQRAGRRHLALVGNSARLRSRDRVRRRRSRVPHSCRHPRTNEKRGGRAVGGHCVKRPQGNFVLLNPCNAVASRAAWPAERLGGAARTRCTSAMKRPFSSAAVRPTRRSSKTFANGARAARHFVDRGRTQDRRVRRAREARAGLHRHHDRARCTSLPRSAVRPSESFHFKPIFPNAGRRSDRARPWCALRIRAIRGDTKETCTDYAAIARLDVARILAADRRSSKRRNDASDDSAVHLQPRPLLERVLEACFEQTVPR